MNAKLVFISGPSKGKIFHLTEAEATIGRESANHISISDLSLSRRHCLISKAGELYKLTDLDSRNGTFVNSVPVRERELKHGDDIRLGDSIVIFTASETEPVLPEISVELTDEDMIGGITVQLRREDAIYLQADRTREALPPESRVARDLNALLKISTSINTAKNLDALQKQLLDMIGEVIPAERGAILLTGDDGEDEFSSVYGWDKWMGVGGKVSVSRTVARQVLRDGVAILSNDALSGEGFEGVQSLMVTQTRSLLAVPLIVIDKTIGVIYLALSDPVARFDEDHLQLVTAIAAIAAIAIENLRRVAWLQSENKRLNAEISLSHNMIGESRGMRDIYQRIARVAQTDSTVLIYGESGTGKELAARALHQNSQRADKPFVAINCAALTETLLESELFGHEKGAFTGAIAQKKGKIEIAQGGTLFLDEMGEMPQLLQAKLLRVLQEREFERVGGTRTIKADIRLIAATNRDLEEEIKKGSFRQDLYYRLNVVTLTMPPLRERREDIPLLANYFAVKYGEKCNHQIHGISVEAHKALRNYVWPGNVRELENAIERAVVLGLNDIIQPEDLPEAVLETEPDAGKSGAHYHEAVREAKKQLILKAVDQAGGNFTEAAKILGVNPNYLHRLIRNLNLKATLKK